MDVPEIVNMVRFELAYKDGWSFDARPEVSYRANYPQVVKVNWRAMVPNSSPRSVDPRPMVIATGDFTVFPGPRDAVEDQILAGIKYGEDHEIREFVRFNGFAPYHPHRPDGENRWMHRRV